MPKTGKNAVPSVAKATGERLGVTSDPVEAISLDRVRAPGQQGILAVDPGDKHVGMAVGLGFADSASDELVSAFEIGHIDGLFTIDAAVNAGWVDYLVVEDWILYEDKAKELVGSECRTARFIGAVEHIVRKYNRWAATVEDRPGVELHLQPAAIQSEAKLHLREYRIERTSIKDAKHALSAELHWWAFVLQRRNLWHE